MNNVLSCPEIFLTNTLFLCYDFLFYVMSQFKHFHFYLTYYIVVNAGFCSTKIFSDTVNLEMLIYRNKNF